MMGSLDGDDGPEQKGGNHLERHYSGPGTLDQGARGGNGEKWTIPEYILEAELTELADRLDVGQKEKIGIRMTPRFLA